MMTFSPELKLHFGRVIFTHPSDIRLGTLRRPTVEGEAADVGAEGGDQAEEGGFTIKVSDLDGQPGKYRLVVTS